MHTLSVNVTDFSRGLSDYLNHVQYRGQVLDIERGKRVVARVSPVDFSDGFPLAQLDDFLARGPAFLPSVKKLFSQFRGYQVPLDTADHLQLLFQVFFLHLRHEKIDRKSVV